MQLTFFECCKHIITASEAMQNKPNNGIHYAASYAGAAIYYNMQGETARVQYLYIHANLSS